MLDYFAARRLGRTQGRGDIDAGAYLRLDRPDRDGPSQARGLFLEPRLDLDQPNRLSARLIHYELQVWRQAHDPNAPFDLGIIFAGAILYATALAFAIFHNFRATRSALLAFSTTMLQQFAVLGLILLFARWTGERAQRR